jgi:hypothetical protein
MLPRLPIREREFSWSAKEVVRDLEGRPHLFLRLSLTGPYFPYRALEPFARVGRVRSRLVRIVDDGRRALAYFDRKIPDTGTIEFGYGIQVVYRFPRKFERDEVELLERPRLPANLHVPEGLER